MLFLNLPFTPSKLVIITAPAIFNFLFLSALFLLVTRALTKDSKRNTPLRGPRNPSFIFGHYRHIQEQNTPELIYEKWAKEYGPAYQVAGPLGSKRIVICDPKANAHFYSRETYGYVQTKLAHVFIENLVREIIRSLYRSSLRKNIRVWFEQFGRGVLWAEGDSHKRQRKTLMPAFSNAAIRPLLSVFYDAVYKMKTSWDATIDNATTESAIIDVQKWMNHASLDSIGIGGFGHDFKALENKNTSVVEVFDSFDDANTDFFSRIIFFLGPVFPTLQNLPTKSNHMLRQLRETMGYIADELLNRSRKARDELKVDSVVTDKSIIGILVRSENAGTKLEMSSEEVLAQMNTLLVAGYATTSISLTWALIELSRSIEKQDKLRKEIANLGGTDPTWEQITSSLPYLDAVVHEVLRLHPPVTETTRVATEDDIIPFTSPITTPQGLTTDKLFITKGTIVSSPIAYINTSTALWGPDARVFKPERWLETESSLARAKEIQGHRHILTFSDGPRICLGKTFALTEFKIILTVLIRHYKFELLDGPETRIEKHPSILPRPKMKGYEGAVAPLRVKRVETE